MPRSGDWPQPRLEVATWVHLLLRNPFIEGGWPQPSLRFMVSTWVCQVPCGCIRFHLGVRMMWCGMTSLSLKGHKFWSIIQIEAKFISLESSWLNEYNDVFIWNSNKVKRKVIILTHIPLTVHRELGQQSNHILLTLVGFGVRRGVFTGGIRASRFNTWIRWDLPWAWKQHV